MCVHKDIKVLPSHSDCIEKWHLNGILYFIFLCAYLILYLCAHMHMLCSTYVEARGLLGRAGSPPTMWAHELMLSDFSKCAVTR